MRLGREWGSVRVWRAGDWGVKCDGKRCRGSIADDWNERYKKMKCDGTVIE